MKLLGKGVLAGHEVKRGKNGEYGIVRFMEETGRTVDLFTNDMALIDRVEKAHRLREYMIMVDYVQNQYGGRMILLSIDEKVDGKAPDKGGGK